MAPEQFQREAVGYYTDLYSLGCTFYFILARKEPFQGEAVEDVIDAHLRHDFLPLEKHRPDIPVEICRWVERLMALAPADRPPGAQEALAELLSQLASRRAEDRRQSPSDGGSPHLFFDPADATGLKASLGKRVAIEGGVQRVWENFAGTAAFINFVGVSHQAFSVVIRADIEGLPLGDLKSLVGASIRATGVITDFHGCPQMLIETSSQISRL